MDPHPFAAPALAGSVLAPSGSELVLAEWSGPGAPPGRPRYVAPLHIHHKDDEAWYVLDGALRFRLADAEVEVGSGGAVAAAALDAVFAVHDSEVLAWP